MLLRFSLVLLALALAGCGYPARAENPPPPLLLAAADDSTDDSTSKPYTLPTFSGEQTDFHTIPPLPGVQPRMEFDAVYEAVRGCYPVPSVLKIDVNALAVAGSGEILNLDTTMNGRYYLGVVAKMPLYSSTELDRVAQREADQNEKVAKDISDFFQAISAAKLAHRQLGLYSSLESRSQARIKTGAADTSEQVMYLEKTIAAQAAVTKAEAEADGLRLRLSAYCLESQRGAISEMLANIQRRERDSPANTVNKNSKAAE